MWQFNEIVHTQCIKCVLFQSQFVDCNPYDLGFDCLICRIHELRTMKQVACLEAHDSEVLCLEFAPPNFGKKTFLMVLYYKSILYDRVNTSLPLLVSAMLLKTWV